MVDFLLLNFSVEGGERERSKAVTIQMPVKQARTENEDREGTNTTRGNQKHTKTVGQQREEKRAWQRSKRPHVHSSIHPLIQR